MPPETRRSPCSCRACGERLRVVDHLLLVCRKSGASASLKATAFAAMMCISGPPCVPGKTALSILARQLVGAEDERAARAAQRLVGGGGDDMAVWDWVGIESRGDQTRHMRDVGHQQRADAIGDLAEAREVQLARIGGEARDDQLGLVFLGQPLQLRRSQWSRSRG